MRQLRYGTWMKVTVAAVLSAAVIVVGWEQRDALFVPQDSQPGAQGTPSPSATPSGRTSSPSSMRAGRAGNRADATLRKAQRRHSRAARALAAKVMAHSRLLGSSTQFTMVSFNALGASHTGGHGDRARMAPGAVRAHWVGQILQAHHADVVSLQEWQAPQSAAFSRAFGGTFSLWPGTSRRGWDGQNSVAWRRSRFELVKAETRSYPYFHGHRRPYPQVLLRDRANGVEFWVTSYHNPAFPQNVGWRHRAVAEEVANANALLRQPGHAPLIIAGDMNDHAGFWCPFATGSAMHAANGGSGAGGCRMPAVQPRPYGFDWILGSPGVQFSGYTWDAGPLVRRTTDHPVVIAHAKVWRTDRVPTR
ncbi:endonuclease/exonuclease/phosphatase family protein [Nocardioides terrisoli]|uniref:endonuclease/exonuclease/phosphatase family protein n=1 Tax=Nocardioides terrisoli TaxID=3388267 RepID=UPI00287BA29E|nr:endonuclease/exonuclease/phosphatase family protein [Nocardioides marmorisolisilvae]